MKTKFLDSLKTISNNIFGTNFLRSYEKSYLEELNSAITYISNDEQFILLNRAAKYRVD